MALDEDGIRAVGLVSGLASTITPKSARNGRYQPQQLHQPTPPIRRRMSTTDSPLKEWARENFTDLAWWLLGQEVVAAREENVELTV